MKTVYIYGLLNRLGIVRYIGKTKDLNCRFRAHRRERPWVKSKIILQRTTMSRWSDEEKRWIKYFLVHGNWLFNKTSGGGREFTVTPEYRKQLSRQRKGRCISREWRINLSHAMSGRQLSVEHRRNISRAQRCRPVAIELLRRRRISRTLTGRSYSLETRMKVSRAVKRLWRDAVYRKRMTAIRKVQPHRKITRTTQQKEV